MTGSIVVQMVHAGDGAHQFAVLDIALIQDCLMDCCADTLAEACHREQWLVAKSELYTWFNLTSPTLVPHLPHW
jgi:hypothetical protein